MSKGGGGGSGGTQTVTNKTELPSWVTDAAKKNLDQSYQVSQNLAKPYEGPRVAGMTGAQLNGINALTDNVGQANPAFQTAINMTQAAGNYDPTMVGANQINAGSYDAATVNPGSYNAALMGDPGRVGADQINAGYLANTSLSPYMNPYTQNVIGSGMQAIDLQRQQALNQNADAAIKAGAFAGGRHGVIDGTTNAGATMQAGQLASQLQAQNFAQAQAAAQGDLARNFAGQQANQGANLTADTTSLQARLQQMLSNQGAQNTASQFNVGTNLQGQLANQAAMNRASEFNLGSNLDAQRANQAASLQAGLANQGAGLQGAGLRLGAANQMGSLGAGQQNAWLQSMMAAMGGQGQLQQQNQAQLDANRQLYGEQAQYPLQQLQIPLQALGMTPYGQTQTQTATGLPQQSSNGFLTGLGGASAGIGILGGLFGGGGIFPGALGGLLK
jgi:hypothetical protein